MAKETQKKRVLRILQDGKTLTSMDGYMIGIVRLTARIFDLKNDGYPIEDKWMVNRHGVKYKAYYLVNKNLERMHLELKSET